MANRNQSNPLLILDLDETLIFGSEKALAHPCDFRVGPFYVYERPGLSQFFETVEKHFDLAVWSSASEAYVESIAARLASRNGVYWKFVWTRTKCITKLDHETFEYHYIKDLRKTKRFGYPKERILIVDDTMQKVSRNYGNAIYPTPFIGDKDDVELVQLGKYLRSIKDCVNFRGIEKRGWRRQKLSES